MQDNTCKGIIINSPGFLVEKERARVFGFTIMNNHMHLIWQMQSNHKADAVQMDFLTYTAQQIKFQLQNNDPELLERSKVNAKDRTFQIWKRNALSMDISSGEVMLQKLNYTHLNPVKPGLVTMPEQYYYSSVSFYHLQDEKFGFLSHYRG